MLISETKLSPDILNGEFVPEGYMGRFRKDRKRGAGGVMIISKDCYKIVDADITVQNENESVWAIITLKDLSKLVVGSFYRPPDRGIQPLLDLEIELAQISEKFRNNLDNHCCSYMLMINQSLTVRQLRAMFKVW